MQKVIPAMLLGMLIGVILGYTLFGATETECCSPLMTAARIAPGTDGEGCPEAAPAVETVDDPTSRSPQQGDSRVAETGASLREKENLFSDELIAYFRREFLAHWEKNHRSPPREEEIATAVQHYKEAVLMLPEYFAEMMIEKRVDAQQLAEALENARGPDLLTLAAKGIFKPELNDPAWELVDRCVLRRSAGAEVCGSGFAAGKAPLEPGMTLVFGSGVHLLDERRLRGTDQRSLPPDILIKGAGIDATLVHLNDIGPRGDVERLAIHDLTLFCKHDGLFDMRSGALVFDLVRVRIVGFDSGHGGCDIFGAEGSLVRAEDAQFIGGYGKAPGSGDLFGDDPVLARFNRCRFELLDLTLEKVAFHGRVVFQNCTFSLLPQNPLEQEQPNVDFVDCVFETPWEKGIARSAYQKQLNDLFWQPYR